MSQKILIVDDEKDVCDALKEPLEHEGFFVKTLSSGKEAIQACERREVFDLALVDIRLEGKVSGIDVIKAWSEAESKPKIAVISATPYRMLKPIFDEQKIDHLIQGFVDKPGDMKPDVLTKKIKDILALRQD